MVYLPNFARAVIVAAIFCGGIGNGVVVVLIPVLQCYAILVVNHLEDISILPTMAPDEEGLTLLYHLRRGLKQQPI